MPARRANELDGTTWTRWSVSPWSDIRWRPGEKDGKHPCPFPLDLASRVIACYTNGPSIIMDPFAGYGTTLLAAYEQGKDSIGFEINPFHYEECVERLHAAGMESPFDYLLHLDTASKIDGYVPKETVGLCLTSPPYWEVMSRKRSADKKATRDYEEYPHGIERIKSYDRYLELLGIIFSKVAGALVPKGHLVINVMDLRVGPDYYPLHFDLAQRVRHVIPWTDTIIWDRRHDYNNIRPLGYPYRFISNRCFEYLLVFRKPE